MTSLVRMSDTATKADLERRGRRLVWAIFPFVFIVPLANLKQAANGTVAAALASGPLNWAYATGLAASVLLILLWYFTWRGSNRARLALGAIYGGVLAIGLAGGVLVFLAGASLPAGWPALIVAFYLYALVTWALLCSEAVVAFQNLQRRPLAG